MGFIDRSNVYSSFRSKGKVADLSFTITVADYGLVKVREVVVSESSQVLVYKESKCIILYHIVPFCHGKYLLIYNDLFLNLWSSAVQNPPPAPPVQPLAEPAAEPRETLEYKAVLQLEAWKETQEEIFASQVAGSINLTFYFQC